MGRKYLKESTKDSIINIEVDEMTPCLRRLKDNTIVKTEVKEIKYKKHILKIGYLIGQKQRKRLSNLGFICGG